MPKVPTNWSNNDVKPAASWTPATKNASPWANNITKKLTAFTGIVKNNVSWFGTGSPFTPNIYDSATDLYDSATRGYDYTMAQSNQLNAKNPTRYTVVV